MPSPLWLDQLGLIIATVTFFVCWFIFSSDTSMILSSFTAALLTSGLVWISYVMIKWLVLCFKNKS